MNSSPYVLTVGATMGPNTGGPEVVCQSNLGGTITSGGGFSTYFPQPSWQASAVTSYLLSAIGQSAGKGYNPNGRGYPDIAFLGVEYPKYVGLNLTYSSGTNCSTPVAAGISKFISTL